MYGMKSVKAMKAAGFILAGAFMLAAVPETAAAKITDQTRPAQERGNAASARLDNLEKMIRDPSASFRIIVALSLGQIASDNAPLSLRVLKLLDDMHADSDDMVRAEAAWQIQQVGLKYPAHAAYAASLLKSMENDQSQRVRYYAQSGLRALAHPQLN